MTFLTDILSEIDAKKKELLSLRPISPVNLKTIREKFRIEYNYHSNHLEGNSLTYGETRSLLFFDVVTGGDQKKRRDYEEMKGHDEAVKRFGLLEGLSFAEDLVKSDLKITEVDVRSIHMSILKQDYEKKVFNSELKARATETVKVGQYKTSRNHVKKSDGTMYFFAEPEDTAPRMQQLLDRLHETMKSNDLHPLIISTIFHYRCIRIHPFSDGNGRTARLLSNIILMHYGYPIIIVPSEENSKQEYYNALDMTDALTGDLHETMQDTTIEKFTPLLTYFGKRLSQSLDRMIAGAKGEPLLDTHDILKDFQMKLELKDNLLKEQLQRDRLFQNGNRKLLIEYVLLPIGLIMKQFALSLKDRYTAVYDEITITDVNNNILDKTLLQETSDSVIDPIKCFSIASTVSFNNKVFELRTINYTITLESDKNNISESAAIVLNIQFNMNYITITYFVQGGFVSTIQKQYGDVSPIKKEEEILQDLIIGYEKYYNKLYKLEN